MSILTAGGVPLRFITDDIVLSILFGGITAAGRMLLAKRDEIRNPATVEDLLDRMEQQTLTVGTPEYRERSRARQESLKSGSSWAERENRSTV